MFNAFDASFFCKAAIQNGVIFGLSQILSKTDPTGKMYHYISILLIFAITLNDYVIM